MARLPIIGQFISQPTAHLFSKVRFQRNYLWDVALPDIGADLSGLGGLAVGELIQSVQFGDYNVENPATMRIGAFQTWFASLLTVRRVQMTFLKTMPDIVSAYFNAWKNLMVDKQGLFHPKDDYQQTVIIRFLDATGVAFGKYKLIGCFPVTFPKYTNLSYEENSITKVVIEFQVDKIEYSWI